MKHLLKTLLWSAALIIAMNSFSAPFDYVLVDGCDEEMEILTIGEPPHTTMYDCRAGMDCDALEVPESVQY